MLRKVLQRLVRVAIDVFIFLFFFFKQKTAYEIVSRDWSSDVCSSDLRELLQSIYKIEEIKRLKERN